MPKHRTLGNTGCPVCQKGKRISKQAYTLFYYLKQAFKDTTLEFPLKGSRMSIDLYIPSQQIAIEYDGGLFHQDTKRDIRKENWLLEKTPNITLIRIREPDCVDYSSPNSKVLKYHLQNQKPETFAHCIEQIFLDTFGLIQTINLDQDNAEILQLMEIIEVENSLGELFPRLMREWDTKRIMDLLPFNSEQLATKK